MLSPDLIKLFENDAEAVEYAAGEVVFRQGDTGHVMYVVVSGQIELTLNDHHLDTVDAGHIFGELALIDSPTRSATATVATPTRLVTVDKRRFTFLVQEHPFFALYVMGVLAQRIRKIDQLAMPA
jgi:CRP-like cAMP-binding protein